MSRMSDLHIDVMNSIDEDPDAPWNTRTWIDTFTHNKAFETHAVRLIEAMNEVREEKKMDKENARINAIGYASTIRMLLGVK